ncbi:MAG: histidine--tRNA ligase [Candidatus Thermoplasmatota archaeon]|nr:histidine--tRNA ligase [Candidatus Thermoplasmatota archaeon]
MFEIPRGTRDFTPEEMYKRRYVERIFRNVFESYGYQEIQTPTFEHIELFLEKSGESVLDEIYEFTDKGNRHLALRPELTAPVMRMYVDHLQMEPKPLKLYYFGNCFRYDRPQKGRYREFLQAGCELIGTNTPEAIAELITLSIDMLKKIGLQNIELQIGNLKLLSNVFDALNLNEDKRDVLLPYIDKEEFDDVEELLYDWEVQGEKIVDFMNLLRNQDSTILYHLLDGDEENKTEIQRLHTVNDLLRDQFSISDATINMGIVRGLDYYTGIVFEVKAPALGAEKQICGGGEYNLISLFGGRDLPTAGFGLGFDRTIIAMEEEDVSFPKPMLDYFIIPFNDELISDALQIVNKLRRAHNKMCDMDLSRRGIGKALKYASSHSASYAVILGPSEMKKHKLTLRNMESGKQEEVDIDEFKNNPEKYRI